MSILYKRTLNDRSYDKNQSIEIEHIEWYVGICGIFSEQPIKSLDIIFGTIDVRMPPQKGEAVFHEFYCIGIISHRKIINSTRMQMQTGKGRSQPFQSRRTYLNFSEFFDDSKFIAHLGPINPQTTI